MSNRKVVRNLSISLSLPYTYKRQTVTIWAGQNVVTGCANAIREFAQRNGVPVSYVEYATKWGV